MAGGNSPGKRVLRALGVSALLLLAVAVGVGSALWAVRGRFASGGVQNGAWLANEHVGSNTAGGYLRAGVALGGLLALSKSETVYFTAFSDEDGEALLASCTYRVEGRDPAARWWSITAYGPDHFLIPGSSGRFSVDRTRVKREPDGRFTVLVGGAARADNWISTADPDAARTFSLTLRLYNPEPDVLRDLTRIELPRIVRERCA